MEHSSLLLWQQVQDFKHWLRDSDPAEPREFLPAEASTSSRSAQRLLLSWEQGEKKALMAVMFPCLKHLSEVQKPWINTKSNFTASDNNLFDSTDLINLYFALFFFFYIAPPNHSFSISDTFIFSSLLITHFQFFLSSRQCTAKPLLLSLFLRRWDSSLRISWPSEERSWSFFFAQWESLMPRHTSLGNQYK